MFLKPLPLLVTEVYRDKAQQEEESEQRWISPGLPYKIILVNSATAPHSLKLVISGFGRCTSLAAGVRQGGRSV